MSTTLPAAPSDVLHQQVATARTAVATARSAALVATDAAAVLEATPGADPGAIATAVAAARAAVTTWRTAIRTLTTIEVSLRDQTNARRDAEHALLNRYDSEGWA